MGSYKLIVFTDPIAGREEEYNEWYDKEHLSHVVAVPGVRSAQRLSLKSPGVEGFAGRYLAIYEFESNDPDAVLAEIVQRSGTPAMPLSDALDMSTYKFAIFETCSDVVTAD